MFTSEDNESSPYITETEAMLRQYKLKQEKRCVFMPLVNFTSYPCIATPAREQLIKDANLPLLPRNYGLTNYVSTHQDHFRNPTPSIMYPIAMADPPWQQFRKVRSQIVEGPTPPKGDYKFLDTHTNYDEIRKLRHKLHQSFNPGTRLKDFPPEN